MRESWKHVAAATEESLKDDDDDAPISYASTFTPTPSFSASLAPISEEPGDAGEAAEATADEGVDGKQAGTPSVSTH